MDQFETFRDRVRANFDEMGQNDLFSVAVNKTVYWNTYLDAFPRHMNQVFIKNRKYDCNCCKSFILNIGTAVNINEDLTLRTVWDGDFGEYQPVADAMSQYIKNCYIDNVFLTGIGLFGQRHSVRLLTEGQTVSFDHFYAYVPTKFVNSRGTIPTVKGDRRTDVDVLKASLELISRSAYCDVLDMIETGTLYKGDEWKGTLTRLKHLRDKYFGTSPLGQNRLLWLTASKESGAFTRVKNHSIGVLLLDLSKGVPIETAVKSYEQIVAPANYKRPKAIFTQRMLDEAKAKIEELGYTDSLKRRFANEADVSIGDVLYRNRDVEAPKDVFEVLEGEVKSKPLDTNRLESIKIKTFLEDYLPEVGDLSLYFDDGAQKNLCSLIAPAVEGSKSMFKWDNGISWAYTGNTADSELKKNVELAGGKVDGVLRFSIMWNDREHTDDDLDAHCIEPNGHRIYFNDKRDYKTTGALDVDIRYPVRGKAAVENIVFSDVDNMYNGEYIFGVHNFACRGKNDGFRAEIEFEGHIYKFDYNQFMPQNWYQPVAKVKLNRDGKFTLIPVLPLAQDQRNVWGVKTNTFVPVSLMCLSPNYWGQNHVGNKHYMFMLRGCKNEEEPYGFYNEFLNEELNANRKVMEALGDKLRCSPSDEQLSGVGYSSTQPADVVLKFKHKGKEKVMKIMI